MTENTVTIETVGEELYYTNAAATIAVLSCIDKDSFIRLLLHEHQALAQKVARLEIMRPHYEMSMN